MGGFGSVVGFMFSFFIIIGLFTSAFVVYEKQIIDQASLRDFSNKQLETSLNLNIELSKPFNYSGKVGFIISNIGNSDFIFKKDSNKNYCVDIYLNKNTYLSKDDFFIRPFYDISKNYKLIKSGEKGILFLYNVNLSNLNSLKLVSCEGKEFNFNFVEGFNNWFNEGWELRKNIFVKNNFNDNLNEYQVEINFNNSNFDFSKSSEDSLRVAMPLKENLVVDIPFNYNQIQEDFSKYDNFGYLGTDSSTETKDPNILNKNCVLDSCANFDGNDDLIVINKDNSLLIDNQITISSWVKWNGKGASLQNIFTNGAWYNALRIVNDGSSNQGKILFQLNLGGTTEYLYSNYKIKDNEWHFISGVYDGNQMKIYVDGKLDVVSSNYNKYIISNYGYNIIGAESDGNYNFNGTLDEVKVLDIALGDDEILNLYHGYLSNRILDYDIVNYDNYLEKIKLFVKIPRLLNNSNINFGVYYHYIAGKELDNKASIKNTFSYYLPRKVGYIVSDRISSSTGISYMSLFDNNNISIGSNSFLLNNLDSGTISTSDLNKNDPVYMKYLSQVEGNGDADDIITPISFAGTEFYYRGFRKSGTNDRFCMLAPYDSSWVEIRDAGVLEWNGTIDSNGNCVSLDIGTNNDLAINSTKPILVSYYGANNQDAFVMFPATNEDLYGVPSNSGLLGSGPDGANINVLRSDGSIDNYNLGAYGTASFSSGGTSGDVYGHKLVSLNGGKIGAIQQADHDGVESTVFVSKKGFSTKFGSALANEYVTLISNYKYANCSIYDGSNNLISNIFEGIGSDDNKIYKYDFGVGSDSTYINGKWYVQCSKPVWGYYEEDTDGDETNMIGFREMRQYVYPEPSILIN